MPQSRRCPQCGAEVPPNSPPGVCPKCLLGLGFDSRPDVAAAPAPTTPPTPPGRFVAPQPAELAKHFPQLEVLELLGQGGMGAVYKARQRQLNRLVALKILPPEVAQDPAFAERFTREAQALAQLNHPHIVTVHDFGQADGLYYFLMEYVDGVNLRRMLADGRLSPAEALAIVPQICEALQYAHDEGVVHRDIKPENLLLDKRGRVKIADFGLARLLGRSRPDFTLTGTQQVMGTPHYMAPEQMERPQTVDHRADIYSLGVVFYEMLTGELPLGRFQAPSKKVEIDVRLDEVVLRSLEKEPERRYQQASEVKTDVETISRSPSEARPESAKGVVMSAHGEPTHQSVGDPRFSRFAIVGAVWALFGLLAVIPTLFFIALNRVWNGTALPTDLIYEQPPLAFTVFMGALLAIGAGAPIGTTVLGGIAIGQIKRSGGRVVGLSLAVADVLFFLLLVINGAIFGVLLFFHHSGLEMNFAMSLYLALGETAFIGGGVSSAIVKQVWNVVSPPWEKSGTGEKTETDPRPAEKQTWLWSVVLAAVCLALVCLIPPGAILLWKMMPL